MRRKQPPTKFNFLPSKVVDKETGEVLGEFHIDQNTGEVLSDPQNVHQLARASIKRAFESNGLEIVPVEA